MKYDIIDHTADFGIRVFAESEMQLFRDAALAMFELLVAVDHPGKGLEAVVSAEGNDRQELMVNWLRELLYLWNGKEKIVQSVRVKALSARTIDARVTLEPYDADRHRVLGEIKAVTYHGIDVSPAHGLWEARIIFDI
ncbi:MAG: archease [Deltaproteobacteria bacterium]|nr:archease [Deltaproteobacteria bacterium]